MKRVVTVLLTLLVLSISGFAQVTKNTIFGDIAYFGCVDTTGKSTVITGTKPAPAHLVFKYKNRIAVRVMSPRFTMTDNSIASNNAKVRIYLYDTVHQTIDSIYHNDLGFRYNNDNHLVMFYRKDGGVGTGPFHDTYHEYDIFLEAIYWNRNDDEMEFRRIGGTSGASEGYVASVNYFRKSDYLKMQALDMKHPMESLNKFIKIYGDEYNQFNINDLTNYLKYPYSQVLTLVLNLQSEGYVEYDKETKMVTVLDRFFDVLASNHGEFDFDVIKFQTRVENRQPNIRLLLDSNDMLVYGIKDYQTQSDVPSITLSDYKHVLILPDNARIVLKKHRNFNFSGCIMAGMYEFFTKDCLFNYSKFSIEMTKVDSLRFYARFSNKVYPVYGTIERLKGILTIDESDNKSSVRETPTFPKFQSEGEAYKFYRDINSGVFDLELPADSLLVDSLVGKFYYCLEPFSMESLDNLNSTDIAFKGRLVSGGIFPDIIQPLVVMDDHSLGFKHVIGDGGDSNYPVYGGKGRFHHEVYLSDEGFYGEGKLGVETSEYLSPRFDFYLDSVVAAVQSYAMHESSAGTHFPKASCGPLDMKWDVTLPQLFVYTKEEPIVMYDNTMFEGHTMLTPEGLRGDGVMTFGLTRLDSKYFDFDTRSFVADSSNFILYDEDGITKAFMAENYRSHVDLNAKKARYEYLDERSNLDFPLNRFYCSLNEAEWDMASNRVHLSSPAESQIESKFVSLLPEHDSLSFNSTNADYDMNDYVIHAHEVTNLFVADAEIIPMNGNVKIMRNAEISPLEHAVIEADTATRMHHFKDAAVSIYSRNNYMALGIKDYVDVDGVATPIFFDEITPIDGVTVAHTESVDSIGFKLSPYFGFKGKITSKASEPYDFFEGSFRLEQSCLEDTVWFVSKANINPQAVEIPVVMDDIKKVRQGIFNGLCYEFGSQGGYHVNFLKPMNPETVTVTSQDGALTYDTESQSYVIQDTLNHQELRLSDRCVVSMKGASNMGFDEGLTHFECTGDFVNYPNDSLTMEIMNVFKAPLFDEKLLEEIADIYAHIEGDPVGMVEYPEDEKAEIYTNTIVIPSMKMVWSPTLRAFVSEGKIGLGCLGKNIVNRYVDGFVMFDRRLGVITYYFVDDMFMTYLSYNCGDGQLQVHATYGSINMKLSDMKEKSREIKDKNAYFEYVVTPYEAITDFLSRLRRAGLR